MEKLSRLITVRNVWFAVTLVLSVSSTFGFIAPETATKLRNSILVPLTILNPGTVDIL